MHEHGSGSCSAMEALVLQQRTLAKHIMDDPMMTLELQRIVGSNCAAVDANGRQEATSPSRARATAPSAQVRAVHTNWPLANSNRSY